MCITVVSVVYGDIVVCYPCMEFVKEELEMTIVWVVVCDGDTNGRWWSSDIGCRGAEC